ncbi:unnamed protein product [Anisakis simplex]|uniref:Uncharacterized protein n=1 Tax=Anisakis simplex TaxID=6269 RepID=A0A0M3IYU3_ANISI|nr:unnamed protein product [Anisakis simplex]
MNLSTTNAFHLATPSHSSSSAASSSSSATVIKEEVR